MPNISVIVPNYNHARFLEQRITSILDQTCQDFELILLDDASTDNSRDILIKYLNHPKIGSYCFNEVNSGSPFKQWIKGIGLAQGEYIWIAESDDYADEHLLKRLSEVLDQNPSVNLAYCQSWQVDANGDVSELPIYRSSYLNPDRWSHSFTNNGLDECKQCLCLTNTIPNASAVVFRNSISIDMLDSLEKFRLCGDWLFWFYLLKKGDIAFIAESLNYFRNGGNCREQAQKLNHEFQERLAVIEKISRSVDLPEDSSHKAFFILAELWIKYLLTECQVKKTTIFLLVGYFRLYLRVIHLNKNIKFRLSLFLRGVSAILPKRLSLKDLFAPPQTHEN